MSGRSSPPKGDVVPLAVVLVVLGFVAVALDMMLLNQALARSDVSAWALFAIVTVALLVLVVLGANVWARSSD